ncbi:MAG: ABC transporter permease [Chloroflexota bacterium]|nr:ABC transporter permease [Chloroflexota bacterium]
MGRFLLLRLLRTVLVVWGVVTVVFVVARLSGDPISLLVAPETPPAEIQALRDRLGLNDPLPIQYAVFLRQAVQGDFGTSLRYRQDALQVVLDRVPATLEIAAAAFAFAVVVAVPVGILSAVRPNSLFDNVAMLFALVGQAVPTFFLGIVLILLFAVRFGWFPTSGLGSPAGLVLPAITLGAFAAASIARLTRSAMLEVLGQDYVRTARAKGLGERSVVRGHALRNALVPVVTIMGLQFGTLLGGSVVTETVFALPGIGRLIIQSIGNRDYPVVQAGVFLIAIAFVVVNLVVDLLYAVLDPRIRLG